MILFRKHYKQAYDKVQGDKTQIAKIIAAANNSAHNGQKKYKFTFRYGTVFAALLVVCVSVYSFPQLRDSIKPMDESGIKVKSKQEVSLDQNVSFAPAADAEDVEVQSDGAVKGVENRNAGTPTYESEGTNESASNSVVTNVSEETSNAAIEEAAQTVSEDVAVANIEPEMVQEPVAEADAAPAVGSGSSRGARSVEPIPAYDGEMEKASGGGSANIEDASTIIVSSYRKEFENTDSYALVTIYSKNEQIEKIFFESQSVEIAGAETVVFNNGNTKEVYIKTDGFYVEIDAYNLSDENLEKTILEII